MEVVKNQKDKRETGFRIKIRWKYVFYLLLAAFFLFLCFYVRELPHRAAAFDNETCYNLTTGWEYRTVSGEKKELTLPITEENNIENGIRLRHTLPKEFSQQINTLSVWTGMRYVDVYLEEELIYQHENATDYGTVEGSGWLMIRLPKEWQGKTITLELTSPYPEYQGRIAECYLGTKASILFELLREYGVNLLISMTLLFVGILLLAAYLILRKVLRKERGIAYLGWFQIVTAIWIFMEGCLAQFFFDNTLVVDTFTYVSLAVMPIPFLLFVSENKKKKWGNVIPILIMLHSVQAILIIILQLLHYKTMYEMVPISHFLIACSSFVIIGISVAETIQSQNKALKIILYSTATIAVSGAFEFLFYYQGIRIYVGLFFKVGLLASMAIITTIVLKKIFSIVRTSSEAVYYEKLALLDFMTQCQNRTAYQKELEKREKQSEDHTNIAIIVADLNNLKQMNDKLGHHIGDAAIKLCAGILLQSFEDMGNCYRIGGDEFAGILHNRSENLVQERVQLFKDLCEAENREWEYEFKVAIGYALFDNKVDHGLEDTMKRADKKMYEDKKESKIVGE